MTKLFIRQVQKREGEAAQRRASANISGAVGICCNMLLCALKFVLGALTGSVAVTADAVNNLSDSASNVVTLTGTRLSGKPDDKEHPFGHGRMEYVAALIVAVSIFVVSFELGKSSVEKILHPQEMQFSAVYAAALAASVLVKLWMAYLNHRLYRLTGNLNLKAVRQDSLNDCLVTAATVISLVLTETMHWTRADGIIGFGVSVFILCSGIGLLIQVISPLLGEAPPKELTQRLEAIITENDMVLGVHDLVLHNYGAGKVLASADAEVDAEADIFAIHRAIDEAERKIYDELNIVICIHMDPVDKTDTHTEKYRLLAEGIVRDYNPAYSLHDFMLLSQDGKTVMRFDLQIPFDGQETYQAVTDELTQRIVRLCPEVTPDIHPEHSYVNE